MMKNIMLYYRMFINFIDCLSKRFSKNVFLEPKCRICQTTKYNCGIVSFIILILVSLIIII